MEIRQTSSYLSSENTSPAAFVPLLGAGSRLRVEAPAGGWSDARQGEGQVGTAMASRVWCFGFSLCLLPAG